MFGACTTKKDLFVRRFSGEDPGPKTTRLQMAKSVLIVWKHLPPRGKFIALEKHKNGCSTSFTYETRAIFDNIFLRSVFHFSSSGVLPNPSFTSINLFLVFEIKDNIHHGTYQPSSQPRISASTDFVDRYRSFGELKVFFRPGL